VIAGTEVPALHVTAGSQGRAGTQVAAALKVRFYAPACHTSCTTPAFVWRRHFSPGGPADEIPRAYLR
jgi:hypothetical protein